MNDQLSPEDDSVDNEQVGDGYEVIRRRLVEGARDLGAKAKALNDARTELYGQTQMVLLGNERVRTENNCVPTDIIQVQGRLLFGYNVFLGLRRETSVGDVLALHRFEIAAKEGSNEADSVDLSALHVDDEACDWLRDPKFLEEFAELYRYYKEAKFARFWRSESNLLAVFRTGARVTDIRAFRWGFDEQGKPRYLDNRGERELKVPPAHDFEWTSTTREDHISGRHPHVSVLDEVFVETVGGDLTIKVEDNTEDGEGIYSEEVEHKNQSLDDADIDYAKLGGLIVLRVKPYREDNFRYLVYSTRTHTVVRVDAIEGSCVQLPEDHGLMFPGGYVLQDGSSKVFDGDYAGYAFERMVRSPNGEDVLFVFHENTEGKYALFSYNLIRKQVASPILCHGYCAFEDGHLVVFRAGSGDEPTRVHPMQYWKTPFLSDEVAAAQPEAGGELGRIGNAELVRGISEAFAIQRMIIEQKVSRQGYEDLISAIARMRDAYYWLSEACVGGIDQTLTELGATAELVIDEFDKVSAIQEQAARALRGAEQAQSKLIDGLRVDSFNDIAQFMSALTGLRTLRGQLITLEEQRYIDLGALRTLQERNAEAFDKVSRGTVNFLLEDAAFEPLEKRLSELNRQIDEASTTQEFAPVGEEIDEVSEGLTLVSEVVSGLSVDDPTARTQILERISEVFGALNRTRATGDARRRSLMGAEGRAEFGAQFRLFSQNVASAMGFANSPEACDEQLSRLMVQLEELEAKFSEYDEFLGDLATKREEVYEALSTKKQQLLDERQRRALNLVNASDRIFSGVERRSRSFKDEDQLNAYFATDPMVLKLGELAERLMELQDSVKAEELRSRLKSARQSALRGLRDRVELYEGDGQLISLGRHQFSVNTQALELGLLALEDQSYITLAGTDFRDPVSDGAYLKTQPYWGQHLPSENDTVYRGEYLAASILWSAEAGTNDLSLASLHAAQRKEEGLLSLVREVAASKYDEGYERGCHDVDASMILDRLLALYESAGMLRYPSATRALALAFWVFQPDPEKAEAWRLRASSYGRLARTFSKTGTDQALASELSAAISAFAEDQGLVIEASLELAGSYLAEELGGAQPLQFSVGSDVISLRDSLYTQLENSATRSEFEDELRGLEGRLSAAWDLARAWAIAHLDYVGDRELRGHLIDEVCLHLVLGAWRRNQVSFNASGALSAMDVDGLLGQHRRIKDGKLSLRLDEFLARLSQFSHTTVPAWREYREARQALIERERDRLRLSEFEPRVLSSFVRNRLINEVYLPLIGDNLAKQLGAVGEGKRTDLMGLLLLISPPGYGKTTLMEYVASRLGLVFMKVNGPSLGHDVHSLDPSEAPNATARQEVEKINLAFEMGNNVMLYLDDIQHTHPELLQKFISLCDAQRRIEGVWHGRTRTYDLRGKKFCVVMAGNPYTETGEKFRIPDMLANRADTYNLGDVLDGADEVFALSYIENSLTSNPVLAPLATRGGQDIHLLIRMAQDEAIPSSELEHDYSGAEREEIIKVLRHLLQVQKVLLAINLEYIRSAATDDKYRTEPAFKLQGSYRNMNKLAEKVVAAMTEDEVDRLIVDHYVGESQTLTTGAEHNMLKLAELRGRLEGREAERWQEIKQGFARLQSMGGDDDDPVNKVTGQLATLNQGLGTIAETLAADSGSSNQLQALVEAMTALGSAHRASAEASDRRNEALSQQSHAQGQALMQTITELGHLVQQPLRVEPGSVPAESGEGQGQAQMLAAIEKLVQRLAEQQPRSVSSPVPAPISPQPAAGLGQAPGGVELGPRLEGLERALLRVADPRLEVTLKTPAALEELLGQQVAIVERTLIPLVRAATARLEDSQRIEASIRQLLALMTDGGQGKPPPPPRRR